MPPSLEIPGLMFPSPGNLKLMHLSPGNSKVNTPPSLEIQVGVRIIIGIAHFKHGG